MRGRVLWLAVVLFLRAAWANECVAFGGCDKTLDGSQSLYILDSDCTANSILATGGSTELRLGGKFSVYNSLEIRAGATVNITTSAQYATACIVVRGNVAIYGQLTFSVLDLIIQGQLYIDSGGSFNADARGGEGNLPGQAPTCRASPGAAAANSDGGDGANGGTHVGLGGDGEQNTNTMISYDNSNTAIGNIGCGGGASPTIAGGAGGGALTLHAQSVVNRGIISARGETMTVSKVGGGAGGSLVIWCKMLDSNGTLNANGGNARTGGPKEAGGGGGGLILVHFELLVRPLQMTVAHGAATGGDGLAYNTSDTYLPPNTNVIQCSVTSTGVTGAPTATAATATTTTASSTGATATSDQTTGLSTAISSLSTTGSPMTTTTTSTTGAGGGSGSSGSAGGTTQTGQSTTSSTGAATSTAASTTIGETSSATATASSTTSTPSSSSMTQGALTSSFPSPATNADAINAGSSSGGGGLDASTLYGVIAGAAVLLLIGLLVVLFVFRRRRRADAKFDREYDTQKTALPVATSGEDTKRFEAGAMGTVVGLDSMIPSVNPVFASLTVEKPVSSVAPIQLQSKDVSRSNTVVANTANTESVRGLVVGDRTSNQTHGENTQRTVLIASEDTQRTALLGDESTLRSGLAAEETVPESAVGDEQTMRGALQEGTRRGTPLLSEETRRESVKAEHTTRGVVLAEETRRGGALVEDTQRGGSLSEHTRRGPVTSEVTQRGSGLAFQMSPGGEATVRVPIAVAATPNVEQTLRAPVVQVAGGNPTTEETMRGAL